MIHESLELPPGCNDFACVRGKYTYYHYVCDGLNDKGWGCGYRTLQTLCSWCQHQLTAYGKPAVNVPDILTIQKALVAMGDKPATFSGSKDWIGSVEVGLCLDQFYDIPCKILHIASGKDLERHTEELMKHFTDKGAPLMMGGDGDAASKGIMGLARCGSSYSLLILDPHYVGESPDADVLKDKSMLLWRPLESFMTNSFYNICMPQMAAAT